MEHLTNVLAAISDPSRRAIIARLSKGPARVTDIAEPFDMSLNAVSKHLKVLEAAGLVRREKQGREHLIEFRAGPLRLASAWTHEYERYWTRQMNRFEAHLKERKKKP